MLLEYMEYVYAVYRERSFSKAAKALYVSQPWLSATVKKVEQAIGYPLFNRGTKPISLTQVGEYYIQSVEQIMEVQKAFRAGVTGYANAAGGRLSIGSSMFFCTYVLPKILSAFRAQYPQIVLSFSEVDSAIMMERLLQGELDFVLEAEASEQAGLHSQIWAMEQIVLAVPSSYPINEGLSAYACTSEQVRDAAENGRSRPPVPLARFENEPFLFLKRGNDIYRRGMELCKHAGFVPKISSYLEQMMTAYYHVCEGRGVAFLRASIPAHVAPNDRVVFYRLDDPLATRALYLTYREGTATVLQTKLIDYMAQNSLVSDGADAAK